MPTQVRTHKRRLLAVWFCVADAGIVSNSSGLVTPAFRATLGGWRRRDAPDRNHIRHTVHSPRQKQLPRLRRPPARCLARHELRPTEPRLDCSVDSLLVRGKSADHRARQSGLTGQPWSLHWDAICRQVDSKCRGDHGTFTHIELEVAVKPRREQLCQPPFAPRARLQWRASRS